MKKRCASIIILSLIAWGVFPVTYGMASKDSLSKIQRELDQIRNKKRTQQSKVKSIDKEINSLKKQTRNLENELMAIDLRRNETQAKIAGIEKEIEKSKTKVFATQQQLDIAKERVAKRESLLKSRVKAMYEHGTTSYLDVLLRAKDFGEFLTLAQGMQMVMEQDTRILEDNQRDKETIEVKHKELNTYVRSLENMYAEAESLKADLDQHLKNSEIVKAALEQQTDKLSEIKEEEEENLLALISLESAKVAEKSKLAKVSNYKGGKLALPLPQGSYRLTSDFGLRRDPFTGRSSGHNGLDMAAPGGTDIYAAEYGIVTVASYVRGYGNAIVIKHNEQISTLYAHIREDGISVSVGQSVKRGQKIAEVGSTGRSTGNHLHFTVYQNDQAVNPTNYIR